MVLLVLLFGYAAATLCVLNTSQLVSGLNGFPRSSLWVPNAPSHGDSVWMDFLISGASCSSTFVPFLLLDQNVTLTNLDVVTSLDPSCPTMLKLGESARLTVLGTMTIHMFSRLNLDLTAPLVFGTFVLQQNASMSGTGVLSGSQAILSGDLFPGRVNPLCDYCWFPYTQAEEVYSDLVLDVATVLYTGGYLVFKALGRFAQNPRRTFVGLLYDRIAFQGAFVASSSPSVLLVSSTSQFNSLPGGAELLEWGSYSGPQIIVQTVNSLANVSFFMGCSFHCPPIGGANMIPLPSLPPPPVCSSQQGQGLSVLVGQMTCQSCTESQCLPNGACDEDGSVCICDVSPGGFGWTGSTCSQPLCTNNCNGALGGNCTAPAGVPSCSCNFGWSGVDCSIASCSCGSHGTCDSLSGGTFCNCVPPHYGLNCSSSASSCVDFPCLNNGVCVNATQPCICTSLWRGSSCEIPICPGFMASDPLSNFPGSPNCDNNGHCFALNVTVNACVCVSGYVGGDCSQFDVVVPANDALVLGLAIGIPLAVLLGVAVAIAVACFYKRQSATYTTSMNKMLKNKELADLPNRPGV
jgi:hypothetical protein